MTYQLPSPTEHATLRLSPWETEVRSAPPSGLQALSTREAEVLRFVMAGLTVRVISDHLGTAVPTVRSQVQSVLHKLGVHSQVEAVAVAYQAGWTPLRPTARPRELDLPTIAARLVGNAKESRFAFDSR
jgi:DNA-binding NarL/FixJ family response regulator